MKRKSHDPIWLEARGYDGLYADLHGEACGCSVHDFAPCGEGPFPECVPAEERDGLFYKAKRRSRAAEADPPDEDRR